MKKIIIIALIVLIIILVGVIIYCRLPYSPEKEKFHNSMKKRTDGTKESDAVCTQEEIKQLPKLLQDYCDYIGLENFPKYRVANAVFKNTDFVFDTASGKVISMDYDLWLFDSGIYRSAFCSSSMFGIPFEGVDYMTEEKQGGMKGILAKHITLFDERDEQEYKAGLISWLAECATINPSALLSPYVTYEEIDETHLKATVSYEGVAGSGIFTFGENGAITEFYSPERQVEEIDGVKTELGWKCTYEKYEKRNGIKIATNIKSVKIFPDGKELVYFAADDYTVAYAK